MLTYPMTRIRIDVKSVRLDILRTIHALEQQGQPPGGQTIASRLDCAHITVKRHIPVLVRDGLVRKVAGSGPHPDHFFLTAAGLDILKAKHV